MSASGEDPWTRSKEFFDKKNASLAGLLLTGLGSMWIAFTSGVNSLITAVFDFWADPFGELGRGIGSLINSIFGGASFIVDVGGFISGANLDMFGFLAFPIGIGIVLLAGLLIANFLRLEITTDSLTGLLTGIDNPFTGVDEDED